MLLHDPTGRFMVEALREARKGAGKTSPNPVVGAVLVVNNKIVARGHHERAGDPHAEVECLRKFRGAVPKGATLYVTMEPCSTIGRTGRCTDVIISSGIRRVVIGALDPNPQHDGRGIVVLRAAGIDVQGGVLESECTSLNEGFNKWIVTGLPFVIAKCGMSLDGRLTRRDGEPRRITSAKARQDAHRLRSRVDAIIIGAETARADNPRLTPRGVGPARQPWRIILTDSGRLPARLKLFCDQHKQRTLVYRKKSLAAVLRDLGRKEITSVLIEGGGNVLGQALDQKLIDKVQIYLGPAFTGGPVLAFAGRGAGSTKDGTALERTSYTRLGDDLRVVGYAKSLVEMNE